MRIREHPILGPLPPLKKIGFQFNDQEYEGCENETIASALIANGIKALSHSPKFKEPRSVFCGIGKCNSCNMSVEGLGIVKACVVKLREGMIVRST